MGSDAFHVKSVLQCARPWWDFPRKIIPGFVMKQRVRLTGAMVAVKEKHCRAGKSFARATWTLLLGIYPFAVAQPPAPPPEIPATQEAPKGIFPGSRPFAFWDDELLIPEVFRSHLPTTLEKYALRLWVHPHLGDFTNKDHLRMTTGIRYGLSENWEASVASDFYFSHGRGEIEAFKDYGAATLEIGTKVNLGQPFVAGWDVAAGFDFVMPTGRPPVELTDGLRHFRPFATFSHRLESHKDVRVFFGFRFDAVRDTSAMGEMGENAFGESSTGVTGGWVIDRKNWHYTFEAEYDTTRWLGRSSRDVFTIRPGVIWEVPERYKLWIKGHWVIGVAVRSTVGFGGTSWGASLKLRYSRDLRHSRNGRVPFQTPR